ncbi:MAG: hypothetical protein HS104_29955 [Polyangiaceae bacterium]|nr:hypothetical protein [Polyangiaceae bacterium]MCL4754661.1 hypothetical protein [Myxococcales bacterium]
MPRLNARNLATQPAHEAAASTIRRIPRPAKLPRINVDEVTADLSKDRRRER